MLHTNFQGHQPFGSREDDFCRFLPYMGMVAILVSLSNGGVTENLASIRQAVSKEKKFSNVETE